PGDQSVVVLTVSPNLSLNTTYDVTVFNVEDVGHHVMSPNPDFHSFDHPGGGSFFSDFDSGLPAHTTVYGNAFRDGTGGVGNSGVMKITDNANSLQGFWLIEDINEGHPIEQ